MTTIRSYTTIEQSRKLAETLPLESADQSYIRVSIAGDNFNIPEEMQYKHNGDTPFIFCNGVGIPCWSLAALIKVLPSIEGFKPVIDLDINQLRYEGKYRDELCFDSENLIDACYEMIIKLHELNLL